MFGGRVGLTRARRCPRAMPAGGGTPGLPHHPSFEEHEVDKGMLRARIAELKAQNQVLEGKQRKAFNSAFNHSQNFGHLRGDLANMEDRRKFIRIGSCENPAPYGQMAPKMKGPPPHEWYQRQVSMVRDTTRRLLAKEDGTAEPAPTPYLTTRDRSIVSNFSSHSGLTANEVARRSDHVLLGLRSTNSAGANRRPGGKPAHLPSGHYAFQEPTGNLLTRYGSTNFGKCRSHVSNVIRSGSMPALL